MKIRLQGLILQFHEIKFGLKLILKMLHLKYRKQVSKIIELISQVLVRHFYLLKIKLQFLML